VTAERERQLVALVKHLIEELYSAWREGAADCHTTGQDEHWLRSDAREVGEAATAKLAELVPQETM